ncbi:MAG: CPBP family intramembrane metalloprotease [Oscillospiraceae bacterium]|nr:CPBP family intramembrane metalloprotease [Oscillospiraceae bacterium]
MEEKQIIYKPLIFIAITFSITWICAVFLAYQPWFGYETALGEAVLRLADFLESASPLLASMFLMRESLFKQKNFFRFILGDKPRLVPYAVVIFLFIIQFLTFYLFGQSGGGITLSMFIAAWGTQILFGGGMEEGGWRAYLQPAFEKKVNILLSVLIVAGIWALWHLPYFFLPNNFLTAGNFLGYLLPVTATAFTLTAIYKLTKSVLLCTLFHGFQNTLVMNFSPNMGNPGFIALFLFQTVLSVILCVKPLGVESET